jgi:hypothetical protein
MARVVLALTDTHETSLKPIAKARVGAAQTHAVAQLRTSSPRLFASLSQHRRTSARFHGTCATSVGLEQTTARSSRTLRLGAKSRVDKLERMAAHSEISRFRWFPTHRIRSASLEDTLAGSLRSSPLDHLWLSARKSEVRSANTMQHAGGWKRCTSQRSLRMLKRGENAT